MLPFSCNLATITNQHKIWVCSCNLAAIAHQHKIWVSQFDIFAFRVVLVGRRAFPLARLAFDAGGEKKYELRLLPIGTAPRRASLLVDCWRKSVDCYPISVDC